MNIFKQLAFINKAKKSWKEAKKLIDSNKGTAEEARQIYYEFRNLAERTICLLPPLRQTIQGLMAIINKAINKKAIK